MLFSQRASDIGSFESDEVSNRAAALYSSQSRSKRVGISRKNDRALATNVHRGLSSLRGKTKSSFQKNKIGQMQDGKSIHKSSSSSHYSSDGLERLGIAHTVTEGIVDHRNVEGKDATTVEALVTLSANVD